MHHASLLWWPLALVLVLGTCASAAELVLTPHKYITRGGPVAGKLNVHIVPHTHDDVGWLKTVDEYYLGANNTIQWAAVQFILDSVVQSLSENPDRKFIYVEIAFFKRWWEQQTPAKQDLVKRLVQAGQLEFINGGWCMSDEAAPYYVDMVDQQTLGHLFLLSTFGPKAIPRAGWQIDPFGHSTTMAALYALMGMDSWYFGRIDYQDRVKRVLERQMEMISVPSASLGVDGSIFTGVLNGYGPPPGFDFEVDSNDAPIQDDERLENVNVQERVDGFVNSALLQSVQYRSDNIMFTMGSDFDYINANTWFKNLDKLIHYVNMDGRVNAFYSTPTIYTEAVHAANLTWTTKTDDFFPYADRPHAFWTGYFTSRPALKGYVRKNSNELQVCRQLEAQTAVTNTSSLALWEAMGLAQHHDAVSGTEKQHVANDYARHLSEGAAECESLVSTSLNELLGGPGQLAFQRCLFLNESVCPITQSGSPTVIVLYNALGQARNDSVSLPVPAGSFTIRGPQGEIVPSDTTGSHVRFTAAVPAMGYATYFLVPGAESTPAKEERVEANADVSIENDAYQLVFDGSSGLLSTIVNKKSGVRSKATQYWAWYNSSTGEQWHDTAQPSGAYIFRPFCRELNISKPCVPYNVSTGPVAVTVTRASGFQEVRQVFAPWLVQTVRLVGGLAGVEVTYTVGPIPFEDGWGKEIVSIWHTDLDTNRTWYTDSNGREVLPRVYNYRPTWPLVVTDAVAGNYYPVDSVIFAQDANSTGRRLTIMTDRAQGGASIFTGELEVMVHRRCLHDDKRGVDEPLNETGTSGDGLVITGIHQVTLDSIANSVTSRHDESQRLTFPLVASFAPLAGSVQDFVAQRKTTFTGLVAELPPNIHLLTVQDISSLAGPSTLLLRLAHLYAVGEDASMSRVVAVDLATLFTRITLGPCQETTLTANQKLSDLHRLQWNFQMPGDVPATAAPAPAAPLRGMVVEVGPMQIRTLVCTYQA